MKYKLNGLFLILPILMIKIFNLNNNIIVFTSLALAIIGFQMLYKHQNEFFNRARNLLLLTLLLKAAFTVAALSSLTSVLPIVFLGFGVFDNIVDLFVFSYLMKSMINIANKSENEDIAIKLNNSVSVFIPVQIFFIVIQGFSFIYSPYNPILIILSAASLGLKIILGFVKLIGIFYVLKAYKEIHKKEIKNNVLSEKEYSSEDMEFYSPKLTEERKYDNKIYDHVRKFY